RHPRSRQARLEHLRRETGPSAREGAQRRLDDDLVGLAPPALARGVAQQGHDLALPLRRPAEMLTGLDDEARDRRGIATSEADLLGRAAGGGLDRDGEAEDGALRRRGEEIALGG